MTNVVWLTPSYPWADDPSAGTFYRTQARAVVAAGDPVTVVCPTPWAPWPLPRLRPRWRLLAAAPRSAVDDGVRVLRPRYPNIPGEPTWARPDRLIAAAAWRDRARWSDAQVIHGHYAITGLAAWRLARRARLPFLLTFHGSDVNIWPTDHPERLADLRTATRQAAAVIAVSAALGDRVRALTGVEAMDLPLGSDHRAIRAAAASRDAARRRLGLPENRTVVLFVGHLKRAKGVRELVDAILALDDSFMGVFVGNGPERDYGTSDPRAADRLRYEGAVPHEAVVGYLSAADVLVLPSSSEGLPTVIVEAGSLKVPVIATPVGGVPELLGNGRGTLLESSSVTSIAAALRAFTADRSGAARAAARLAELVHDRYDVDRNTRRLVELYDAAAAAPRSA